jgi:hypothetical protein
MLYFATVGYLVEVVKKSYNGIISYVGTFSGLRGNATNVSSVQMVSPYGHGAIPPIGLPAFILPINGSHKSNACLGYLTETVDNIKDNPVQGEGWLYSQNYVLLARLSGLQAYKYGNTTYFATLPNGEFVGQMLQNRITEIENMISEINNNYNTLVSLFNSHAHSGVQGGNSNSAGPLSPLSQTQLPIPNTLSKDTNYITNENYLINDSGTLY